MLFNFCSSKDEPFGPSVKSNGYFSSKKEWKKEPNNEAKSMKYVSR